MNVVLKMKSHIPTLLVAITFMFSGCGRSVTLQANAESVRSGMETLGQARERKNNVLGSSIGAGVMLAHGVTSKDSSEMAHDKVNRLFAGAVATGVVINSLMPESKIGEYHIEKFISNDDSWKASFSKDDPRILVPCQPEIFA